MDQQSRQSRFLHFLFPDAGMPVQITKPVLKREFFFSSYKNYSVKARLFINVKLDKEPDFYAGVIEKINYNSLILIFLNHTV